MDDKNRKPLQKCKICGFRSVTIVTTKVTDEILQYWLKKDKKDVNVSLVYTNGRMKAAQ